MKKETKVKVNLDFYRGEDNYSDGDRVENMILEACEEGKEQELLKSSSEYPVLYHLSDIRHNVIEWYEITKNETVLEIGSGCGAITGVLAKKAESVTCVELSKRRSMINAYRNAEYGNVEIMVGNFQDIEPNLGKYDVITLIGVWEYSGLYIEGANNPYLEMLKMVKSHLKPDGRLFIAIENKMGLKYFNGAFEDHTGKQYSGLNDYINNESVRTFSKNEIESLLNEAGFGTFAFRYPLPDYKLPEVIYSDDYLPKACVIRDFGKNYDEIRFYNFMEATAYDQVCEDDMFRYFANSFIVTTGKPSETVYAKYHRERAPFYRIATTINRKQNVWQSGKYALNEEAFGFVKQIKENESKWQSKKMGKTAGSIVDGRHITQFVNGESLDHELYALRNNHDEFIGTVHRFIDDYITPSEEELVNFELTKDFIDTFGRVDVLPCKSMKVTNIDLNFSNLIKNNDGEIVCIDFEWVFDFPIPYKYVLWRALDSLYAEFSVYLKRTFDRHSFIKEFGIEANEQVAFEKMEEQFLERLHGPSREEVYTSRYKKNAIMNNVRIY